MLVAGASQSMAAWMLAAGGHAGHVVPCRWPASVKRGWGPCLHSGVLLAGPATSQEVAMETDQV